MCIAILTAPPPPQQTRQYTQSFPSFLFAQPKIQLCSKYERHTDHRTYVERKDLFEELAKEPPPPEIVRVGAGEEEQTAEDSTAEETAAAE